jgi:environmental stress-induced protein Ves
VTLSLVRFARTTSQPWSNGLGTTREIVRSPPDGARFDWRISVADVEADGPFSTFAGIDRTIVLCEGPRMVLTVDGQRIDLVEGVPCTFSGDAVTTCRVPGGPTRDLNVMCDRLTTGATTRVVHVQGRHVVEPAPSGLVVVALTPGTAVRTPEGHAELTTFDAVHSTGSTVIEVDGRGTVLEVRLEARPPGTSARTSRGG